ncbi:MAG: Fumarylacetoacetate hydrolase family protein, partial [uncultured Acetobacteraceae bacterium]
AAGDLQARGQAGAAGRRAAGRRGGGGPRRHRSVAGRRHARPGRGRARHAGARPRRRQDRPGGGGRDAVRPRPAPAQERLLRRQELPRAREGVRRLRLRRFHQGGGAGSAGGVQQAGDQRHRPRRAHSRRPRSDRLGGLRGRAGGGDRPRRARHPQGGRAFARVRLHDRQRRDRAHPPAPPPAMDPGQGLGRLLPDGPGHPHRRRGARSRGAAPDNPRQRREAAGRAGVRPHLRHPDPDRDDQRRDHPGARRHHRHRHAGRGRHRLRPAALPPIGRRGADRGGAHRRAGEPGRM